MQQSRDILPTPPTSSRTSQTPVRTKGLASSNVLSGQLPQSRNPLVSFANDGQQWGNTYSDTSLTPFPSTTALSSAEEAAEEQRVISSGDLDSDTHCQDSSRRESENLEPKRSLHSPALSKRSVSASMVKKVLPEGLHASGPLSTRVASAGDVSALRKKIKETSEKHPGPPGEAGRLQEKKKKRKDKAGPESLTQDLGTKKTSVTSSSVLPFWEADVLPLLQELESASYEDVSRLNFLCESLWTQLDSHQLLGRTGGVGGSKRRGKVLRTVFKLLDHDDSLVLLKVARVIVGVSLLFVCGL